MRSQSLFKNGGLSITLDEKPCNFFSGTDYILVLYCEKKKYFFRCEVTLLHPENLMTVIFTKACNIGYSSNVHVFCILLI